MNDIALESFISYCDNMMIANESMKDITDIYEKSLAYIKEIQEKVRRETLLKKRIALYTNLKSALSDLKTTLSHEKAIGIRDLPKILVNALPGAIIGTLTIAGVKHYKKEGKTGDAKTTGIAGGLPLLGSGYLQGLLRKPII